jgi:phage baseplate assembly protein gpV
MIKAGLISEIGKDEWKGYARVFFDELNIVSYWLSLPCRNTAGVKEWCPVELNQQVYVDMHPNGEDGQILYSIYSDNQTPPDWATSENRGVEFPDGSKMYYDWNSHKYICSIEGEIVINGGKLGGLTKTKELKKQLDFLTARVDAIINGITNGVIVPADGGASFKASIIAVLNTIVQKESFSNIENTKIKQ